MCKIGDLLGALTTIHGYLVAAIALMIGAIATNASFWGAITGATLPFLAAAGLATVAAATTIFWVHKELELYFICMHFTTGKAFTKCAETRQTIDNVLIALGISLGVAGASIAALAFISFVPGVAIPGMLGVSAGLATALGLLVGLDVLIANYIDCLRKEAGLDKKDDSIVVADLAVLSCPMNKAICQDNDLRLAGQLPSGTYATTASFAVALTPGSTAINSVTADITDSFGKTSNSLAILQPNQHAIHDPAAWVVRGDWSVLSNDIRVERLPKNIWTLDLEMKMANRKTEKHTVTLMINH